MLSGNYRSKKTYRKIQGSLSKDLGVGERGRGLRSGPWQRLYWPRTSPSPLEKLIQQQEEGH